MKKRFYFASGNTNLGFVNHFNYILDDSKPHFTYVIKGCSGCGKSTFMKKIANYFESKNLNLEYFYCSSDPNSLDGICLSDFNICIVDGTAPHVLEPKLPQIFDKLINLGDFISYNAITSKTEIISLINNKKSNYDIIYNYLSSIGYLEKINYDFYKNNNTEKLKNELLSCCSSTFNMGRTRKLFIDALDTNGITDFTYKNDFTIRTLPLNKYEFGFFANDLVNSITLKGNDITLFYNIFSTEYPTSFLINDKILYSYDKNIPLNNMVLDNVEIIDKITNKASYVLAQTRALHFKLEKVYSNYIKFDNFDKILNETILDIEKRI